jgi:hypothetical protein
MDEKVYIISYKYRESKVLTIRNTAGNQIHELNTLLEERFILVYL